MSFKSQYWTFRRSIQLTLVQHWEWKAFTRKFMAYKHPWLSLLIWSERSCMTPRYVRVVQDHESCGTRNDECLCWQRPAAIYPTDGPIHKMSTQYLSKGYKDFNKWHGLQPKVALLVHSLKYSGQHFVLFTVTKELIARHLSWPPPSPPITNWDPYENPFFEALSIPWNFAG
jgi:hypothetical protein